MELGIIEKVLTQGGMFGIALFTLFVLREQWKRSAEREEKHGADRERMWDMTRQALEHNTEALTRLAERLEGP